ncbi:MAG: hypothetical protein KME26_02100 [Oscillatoria princeps RMCB-10]|nr:hypothetical protein [Oscillatoria princeps RMCB-10]
MLLYSDTFLRAEESGIAPVWQSLQFPAVAHRGVSIFAGGRMSGGGAQGLRSLEVGMSWERGSACKNIMTG